MMLILKILAVAIVHLAIFIGYSETGAMGNVYLWISLAAWIGLLIFFNINIGFFKGMASLLWHSIFFSAMILIILITMPQFDKTPVIKKIFKKNFPTRESISHGLIKFGIGIDKTIKQKTDNIVKEIDKAVKKLHED